jgi:hypothetical protein
MTTKEANPQKTGGSRVESIVPENVPVEHVNSVRARTAKAELEFVADCMCEIGRDLDAEEITPSEAIEQLEETLAGLAVARDMVENMSG